MNHKIYQIYEGQYPLTNYQFTSKKEALKALDFIYNSHSTVGYLFGYTAKKRVTFKGAVMGIKLIYADGEIQNKTYVIRCLEYKLNSTKF